MKSRIKLHREDALLCAAVLADALLPRPVHVPKIMAELAAADTKRRRMYDKRIAETSRQIRAIERELAVMP